MASAEAQKAKDRGNAAFKAGNFPEAIGHYTAAILADRNDPTYPLNRAAAYLKLGKYEDAQRDCSLVLDLKPGHVKALYRRAQARTELGNLSAAQKDLTEALRLEPSNDSIKSELDKINALIHKPKASRVPIDIAVPKRRRVPIKVVEPTASTSTIESLSPTPSTSAKSTASRFPPAKEEEGRSKPSASPTIDLSPATSPVAEKPAIENPGSADAPKPTANARGGIFRPSGNHTIFRPPSPPTNARGTQHEGKSIRKPKPFSTEAEVVQRPPISLFEFTRSWDRASPPERWDLICKIPPPTLPIFFKTSMDEPLLMSIIEVFSLAVSSTGDVTIKKRVQEYLNYFPKVPRFNTVTMFMSKEEKDQCKALIDSLGGVTGWRI